MPDVRLPPMLVLLVGLLVTTLTTSLLWTVLHQRDAARFKNAADITVDRVAQRFATYEATLRATAAFVGARGGEVDRETFRAFSDRLALEAHHRGIFGIGFTDRDGARFDVDVIEPLEVHNSAAVGFDMFSEPVRREAMLRAWATASPALSGRVTLKQDTSQHKQHGFLLYVPVFSGGVAPPVDERADALLGFAFSPFRCGDLFDSIFAHWKPRASFRGYDGEALAADALLYDSGGHASQAATTTRVLWIAGRPWTIELFARPIHGVTSAQTALALAALGLGVTLVLYALSRAQERARMRAERSEARLRFLLELDDALRGLDDANEVMATAARMLGERLDADRCAYAEADEDDGSVTVRGDWTRGVPSIVGRFRFGQLSEAALRSLRVNEPFVVDDTETDPRLIDADRAEFRAIETRAAIMVAVLRNNRFSAGLAVHQRVPRVWTEGDVELVVAVTSRCGESIERARGERRLRDSVQRANDAVRVRDEFLSIASHELRTPIAALVMQIELLRRYVRPNGDEQRAAEIRRRLDTCERQLERLTALVNDLFDVSKMGSGRLQVQVQDVDVAALVRDVVARRKSAFERAGSEVRVDMPPLAYARVDAMRMDQVVDNLLENAVKYGAGAPIEVAVQPGREGTVEIVVRDHGIGIASADHARIFERYERAAPSQHYGGLGLGLWITRQIVEAMGGTIEVESAIGAGATFIVRAPAAPVPRVEAGAAATT